MLVGCVSFDCHQGSPFFSHQRCTLLSRLCLLLLTPLALYLQKATPVPTTTLALSPQKRSLARSVCSDVPAGLSRSPPPAVHALRITLNFSPPKAGAAACRSAARARRRKGPERTSTAPSSALSPRPLRHLRYSPQARSPRRKSPSR
jgi:hypothetical protein